MDLVLTVADRATLEAACAAEPRVRVWRRYRAVLLLGDGLAPPAVAEVLG